MTDPKRSTENAKWLFERTLGWIATADVKVGVVVALDTAMLGGLAAAFVASEPSARTAWTYLATLTSAAGLAIAVFCAAMAEIPRMLGPVASNIYFARIAEKSESQYADDFKRLSEEDFLHDLAVQVHRNSQIATAKHVWIRKGLIWSFIAAIPWLAAISLLVKL